MVILIFNYSFGQQITIVDQNKSNAVIVVPKNSSSQINNVAVCMQQYIYKSSGANLKILTHPVSGVVAINIGNTDFVKSENLVVNNANPESFIIRTFNNKNIIILGKSDWGTEYGVYDFLEKFVGIEWLMPTDLGTDIPTKSTIIIPYVNYLDAPVYLSRGLSPVDVTKGGSLNQWGRFNRVRNNIQFHHNMNNLFAITKFGKTHPDFYANYNITRMVPKAGSIDWQPDFSAPNIALFASNEILNYFRSNPSINSYSLGINDSKNFDNSYASTQERSGQLNLLGLTNNSNDYFKWANEVAERVNKVYPDKIFGCLAYNNLIEPPSVKIGVNSHIVPFITEERMRWNDPDFQKMDKNLTLKWKGVAKNIGWYDYDYGFNYIVPRVWFHTMKNYLLWGSQNNVRYYYAELYPNWGEGPKAWIAAKLLWNPNQNVDSLLSIWYNKFAGNKAAPYLKAYYDTWENFWENDILKSKWFQTRTQYLLFSNISYAQTVPDTYVQQSDAFLNKALSLTITVQQKNRVEELIKMWKIYKTAILQSKKLSATKLTDLKNTKILVQEINALKADSIHQASCELLLKYIN